MARNVSSWVRTAKTTRGSEPRRVEAVAAAHGPPGQVATLILPADVSWDRRRRARRPARGRLLPPLRPQRSSRQWRGVAQRRAGRDPARRQGFTRSFAAGRRPHRRGYRREGIWRGVPRSTAARRGPAVRSSGSRTSPNWPPSQLAGLKHLDPCRRESPSVVLRLPRQEELPGARRLPSPRNSSATVAMWSRKPGRAGGSAWRRPAPCRSCSSRPAEATDRRTHRGESVPGDRGRAPRGRNHFRRGADLRADARDPHPWCAAA